MSRKKTSPVDECVANFGQPDISCTYGDLSKFLVCSRKKELVEIVMADPKGAADVISQLQSDHAMLYLRATVVLKLARKAADEAERAGGLSPTVKELKEQIENMQSGLTPKGQKKGSDNNKARADKTRKSIRNYFKGMKKNSGKSLKDLINEARENKPEVLLKKPDEYKDKSIRDIPKKELEGALYGTKYLEKNILKNLLK